MKKKLLFNAGLIVTVLLVFSQCTKNSQRMEGDLEAGFQDPPASAKPRVWWHWMNGNITQEGIRKDLEWMDRIGIGGFQNFDAALILSAMKQLMPCKIPWIADKKINLSAATNS